MTDFYEIHWTSGSLDEARKVCRYVVQERLVAYAQIIPWIESVFMWNNQLETAQESKIILKAPVHNLETIAEVIRTNCSYEVPEILYIKIEGGNSEYLDWLAAMTPSTYTEQKVQE